MPNPLDTTVFYVRQHAIDRYCERVLKWDKFTVYEKNRYREIENQIVKEIFNSISPPPEKVITWILNDPKYKDRKNNVYYWLESKKAVFVTRPIGAGKFIVRTIIVFGAEQEHQLIIQTQSHLSILSEMDCFYNKMLSHEGLSENATLVERQQWYQNAANEISRYLSSRPECLVSSKRRNAIKRIRQRLHNLKLKFKAHSQALKRDMKWIQKQVNEALSNDIFHRHIAAWDNCND